MLLACSRIVVNACRICCFHARMYILLSSPPPHSLPPGEWYSETEHTDSPTQFTPSSSRPETAHIVSVDLQPANQSTSSDVRKHETEALQPSDDLPDNGHDQTAPFTPVDWRECGRPPRTVPNGQYYATSPPALKRRLPPDQHNDCGSPVGSEGFEMPGPAGMCVTFTACM